MELPWSPWTSSFSASRRVILDHHREAVLAGRVSGRDGLVLQAEGDEILIAGFQRGGDSFDVVYA